MKKPPNPDFNEKEIARRRDAAILRALMTPARPQKIEPKPQSTKGEAQRNRRDREKAAKSGG